MSIEGFISSSGSPIVDVLMHNKAAVRQTNVLDAILVVIRPPLPLSEICFGVEDVCL